MLCCNRLPQGMLVTHSFVAPKHLTILMTDRRNCKFCPATATFVLRFLNYCPLLQLSAYLALAVILTYASQQKSIDAVFKKPRHYYSLLFKTNASVVNIDHLMILSLAECWDDFFYVTVAKINLTSYRLLVVV